MKDIILRLLAIAVIVIAILIFGLKPALSQEQICEDCLTYSQEAFGIMQKNYYLELDPVLFEEFKLLYFKNNFTLLKEAKLPSEELKHTAVRFMVNMFKNDQDKFTRFIPKQKTKVFKQITQGIQEDSGVRIERSSKGIEVVEVQKRSAAADQGMELGQVITSLEGVPAEELSITQVEQILSVKPNQTTQIEVRTQKGQVQPITVTGKAYEVETTHSNTMVVEEGSGIEVKKDISDGNWKIAEIERRSPASQKNLDTNDALIQINEELTTHMSQAEVAKKISPPKGEVVQIKLKSTAGDIKDVKIESAAYFSDSTIEVIDDNKSGILQLSIDLFNDFSYADTLEQIQGLGLENIEHMIIDLRANKGGDGFSVIEFLSLFFNQNELLFWVDVKRKPSPVNVLMNDLIYLGPLTVLVNSQTGSAAELFASVIQSKKRGRVAGQATEGSTFLKQIHTLSDEASLYLTTSKIYSHSQKELGFDGLEPDWSVGEEEDVFNLVMEELEHNLN